MIQNFKKAYELIGTNLYLVIMHVMNGLHVNKYLKNLFDLLFEV